MSILDFKKWAVKEMADYGFDADSSIKPKGGSKAIEGDLLFKTIDGSLIIDELVKFPSLGENEGYQKWHDSVEWGNGPGAIRVNITPLGSMKIVTRRLIKDLVGENTWICKKVFQLKDSIHTEQELDLADKVYKVVNEINDTMMEGPSKDFEDFERLAWKLWANTKRNHPSYCMFPTELRKQNDHYFKLIFEFKGHGVERQGQRPGRAEQFNIDLFWDEKRGLIKCWGYDIQSTMGQHSWKVTPSDWDEMFSPSQKQEEIIEAIINTFMQY